MNIRKIPTYKISRKSVQWEPSCSMRTGRGTDMTKLVVPFRRFAKAPNETSANKGVERFCKCYLLL